jgi:hypothetical protein
MRIAKIGVNKDGFKVASQRTCPPVLIKECLPFEVLFIDELDTIDWQLVDDGGVFDCS